MSHILHRSLRHTLPLAVAGHGIRIVDDQGNRVNAHGGGIMRFGGMYFWYGEHKGGTTYFDGHWDRVDVERTLAPR